MRAASFVIAAIVALALSAPAEAASSRSRQKAEPPPPPPQFKVDVATRSMTLARVASSVPNGSNIGKFSTGGCGLIKQGEPIILHPEDAFRNVRPEDYTNIFTKEAAAAGYTLPASQQGSLFDEKDASPAELSVGAGITGLQVDGCYGQILIVRYAEVDATITVDWQVFDPLAKKLLFRTSKVAHGKLRLDQFSDTVVVEGTREAFREAAKAVLSDPAFILAVKDPKGGSAPANDTLFPEAAAPASSGPLALPHLPLSTKDFSAQVDDCASRSSPSVHRPVRVRLTIFPTHFC